MKTFGIGLLEHFGDIIAAEPVARYIRKIRPESTIVWCVNNKYIDILKNNPYIDVVLGLDCIIEFKYLLNNGFFDEAISLHMSHRYCDKCKENLGIQSKFNYISEANYYLYGTLLEVFSGISGLPILDTAPIVYSSLEDKKNISKFKLPEHYIVIHCLSNDADRNWKDIKWLELAKLIKKTYNIPIVEVGLSSVLGDIAINLCNKASLLETAEIISNSDFFIGIDSGPAHFANAFNINSLILLGEFQIFKKYIPYNGFLNDNKNKMIIQYNGKLSNLEVDEVFNKFRQNFLKTNNKYERKYFKQNETISGLKKQIFYNLIELYDSNLMNIRKFSFEILMGLAKVSLKHNNLTNLNNYLSISEQMYSVDKEILNSLVFNSGINRGINLLHYFLPNDVDVAIYFSKILIENNFDALAVELLKNLINSMIKSVNYDIDIINEISNYYQPTKSYYRIENLYNKLINILKIYESHLLLMNDVKFQKESQNEYNKLISKYNIVDSKFEFIRKYVQNNLKIEVAKEIMELIDIKSKSKIIPRKLEKIAIFSICSANYIPTTMVLFTSLAEFYPEADLHLFICERSEIVDSIELPGFITIHKLDELNIDNIEEMAFYYNITELNTAIKPFAFKLLFKNNFKNVLYFDPDICIYSSLRQLISNFKDYDLLVTPHMTKPFINDGRFPGIKECIHAGQFNLGFIGLKNSNDVEAFLNWWGESLIEMCLQETNYDLFVDQFWASASVSFIDKSKILRYSGYNMAYWNIEQRELKIEKENYYTEQGPLCFFHFSGLDTNNPTVLSKYSPKGSPIKAGTALSSLVNNYIKRVESNKILFPFSNIPYSFSKYSNGTQITNSDRRAYLKLSKNDRKKIGNPFNLNLNINKSTEEINNYSKNNSLKNNVKITKYYNPGGISVSNQSHFATEIDRIITNLRPSNILESGTFHATGTTKIIVDSIIKNRLDSQFYTIECNPDNYKIAKSNILNLNQQNFVEPLLGLSVPRKLLPKIEEIESEYVLNLDDEEVFIDHDEKERALLYHAETNFLDVEQDLIGKIFKKFNNKVEFILLDSGGHMGFVEFNYVLTLLQSNCIIALDDIAHIKHYKSFKLILSDRRFKILSISNEKFGFCIAYYSPNNTFQNVNSLVNISLITNFGVELFKKGYQQKSLDYFIKIIEKFPDNAELINNLGVVYNAIGNKSKAIECFSKSLEILPGYEVAIKNLNKI